MSEQKIDAIAKVIEYAGTEDCSEDLVGEAQLQYAELRSDLRRTMDRLGDANGMLRSCYQVLARVRKGGDANWDALLPAIERELKKEMDAMNDLWPKYEPKA